MRENTPYTLALEEVKNPYPYNYPNPCVGAVIYKNGRLIGQGHTKPFPGRHAEINAIDSVKNKEDLKGATLYVTLMPCCHHGKTPPCTTSIIDSGIGKVVVALDDPNPHVFGKSRTVLEQAGIEVEFSFPRDVAKACFEYSETFFVRYLKKDRPFVTLKYAMTLDGKMADFEGNSKWISSEASRDRVHQMRAAHDGILVGENTVVLDNPQLTVRGYGEIHQPRRIVLNVKQELSEDTHVFNGESTLFLLSSKMSEEYRKTILRRGHEYIVMKENSDGYDLMDTFKKLKREFNMGSIFLEGGSSTMGHVWNAGLIDKLYVFIAPRILGDGKQALSPLSSKMTKKMENLTELVELNWTNVGTDVLCSGYVNKESFLLDRVLKG